MSSAGHRVRAGGGGAAERLRRHFRRMQAAEHAVDYLRGLVAEVERKNGWQLEAGYAHPQGSSGCWIGIPGTLTLRDDLHTYVIAELGDPCGVLVVDETGFPN
jgi:hypothetical protein